MLELKKGVDILTAVGGIASSEQAQQLFRERLDARHLGRLEKINSEEVRLRIANAIAVCQPDEVFINTGSHEDMSEVRRMSIAKGEERPLALPDHTIHFDLPQEQGRIVDRTYYIVNPGERVSVLAEKMLRDEALGYVKEHMTDIMKGKTMFVGFFTRGPAGARLALPAIQISSSAYVMHSADILYRHGYNCFDKQIELSGLFLTNVHSEGLNRPQDLAKARVFMDRSWLTTYCMFCTYAGNTLLLKKGNHRFAVDLATYYGGGRELSEHMFITGMRDTSGRITWFAGAAPSGCGKTTTAMAGSDFVGDDLAQMWIAEDGTLRAINPECGIFGIVADVNRQGDPMLMQCLREPRTEVIWSNVLVDEQNVPHWIGDGENPPASGINFQGPWFPGRKDSAGKEIPVAHPNARCTLRAEAIANFNEEFGHSSTGVPIKVITYSGRDADTMPPVLVAKTPDHGVVLGASIVSAATATEVGAQGIKRQPWANAPFIPGPLADYMSAQFAFFSNPRLSNAGRPILAGLNYFLTDQARGGSTPRLLGEKRDVSVWLTWLARRAAGDVDAIETPIGFIPLHTDLKDLFAFRLSKEYPRELYDRQFSIYADKILARIDFQRQAFSKETDLPSRLFEVYDEWSRGLGSIKKQSGPVIPPGRLLELNFAT